jgi:hypothetical protein
MTGVILSAQEPTTPEAEAPRTLQAEYENLLKTSNNYQDFEVIKRTRMESFFREIKDSLKLADDKLLKEIKTKNEFEAQVMKLSKELEETRMQVSQAQEDRDSITSAGMTMEKGSFSTLMWSLVIILAAALLFVLFRTKAINATYRAQLKRLNEVEEELGQSKKKFLEREQELKREIQDYVNKLDSMTPPR